MMRLFQFRKTEYANPGAENYAYIPNTTLPGFAVGGSGSMVLQNMDVFQSAQLMTQITIPTAGYGGLISGQFVQQPLQR